MIRAFRLHSRSVALFALIVATAQAHSNGQYDFSGRTGATCTRCHTGTAARPAVSVNLTPVNTVLPPTSVGFVPGASYTLAISVTGGPNLRWGFDSDASAGTAILTQPTLMQHRGMLRSQDVTHTTAGTRMSSWSYVWVAPQAAAPVTFWVAVNSANNNGGSGGDGIAATSFVLNPVPPEVLCRFGGVNGGQGIDNVVSVLTINGSAGDDLRRVTLQTGGSFSMEIAPYPGSANAPIRYVVYALQRENTAADVKPHPYRLGNGCFSTPLTGGGSVTVVNTVGTESISGRPVFQNAPLGPGTILAVSPIPSSFIGRSITVQGIVPDTNAANGRGAFTNAVVIQIQ